MPYGAGSTTLSYDIENRVIQAVSTNGTERYGYSSDNRRVYQKKPNGAEPVHLYGVNGDRLRTYGIDGSGDFSVGWTNIYFAGKPVWQNNAAAFLDRLGSNRNGSRTPLFFAAKQGHVEAFDLLIRRGAAIEPQDNIGKTALDWAKPATKQRITTTRK